MKYDLALFCDNDKYAAESYCAVHHADPKLNIGDITKVDEKAVPQFNVMFGGSPCQDFSTAGSMGGSVWKCKTCGHSYNPLEQKPDERDKCPICGNAEIDKTRSSLLVEWLRFLREKKPYFAIYENVKAITNKRFRTVFSLFIREAASYGYNVYWKTLNAKDYGVPQHRERVYCVMIRKDKDNGKFRFPDPIPLDTSLMDLLEKDVNRKYELTGKTRKKLLTAIMAKEADV